MTNCENISIKIFLTEVWNEKRWFLHFYREASNLDTDNWQINKTTLIKSDYKTCVNEDLMYQFPNR